MKRIIAAIIGVMALGSTALADPTPAFKSRLNDTFNEVLTINYARSPKVILTKDGGVIRAWTWFDWHKPNAVRKPLADGRYEFSWGAMTVKNGRVVEGTTR